MKDKKLFYEKKKELLYWIDKLGLSRDIFAERVFYHMNNNLNFRT